MHMKSVASLLAVLGALAAGSAAPGANQAPTAAAATPRLSCADLGRLTFEGNTTVTTATTVSGGALTLPAGQSIGPLPEFCRVVGVSKPTADSHINFEVWLPVNGWNGKFLSSGEGGFVGVLNYTRGGLDGGLDELLRRGYATASTDTGHVNTDEFWAIGHPERVADYAYRSKHLVTVAAKGLISAFYGKPPDKSYFNSCSNGGRQGLIELQRYPADYDGVVVGAPWAFQSRSSAGIVWSAQVLAAPGASIPESKLPAIEAAALARCDKIDGLADGLIEDPRRCQFDPSELLCKAGDSNSCLTQPQVDAVKKLYAGPSNPRTGEKIFPGWTPGSEGGWKSVGTSALPRGYFGNLVFENKQWDFKSFDFDKDMATADAKIGRIANAISTDFSAAKARGAKVIMYHGWNDAVLQPAYTPQYYEQIAAVNGGIDKTQDFMRLFMVPGMGHCYAGPGANSFGGVGQQITPVRDGTHDVQVALEAWVEKGVAPSHIVATKFADDAPATRTIKFTRVLCPYPQVSKYKGSGSQTDATNFQCVAP
jgi:feruloyl esterase